MSVPLSVAPVDRAAGQAPLRVMVVDDAVVVRGLLSRWIEAEPGLHLVASLRTGREAIAHLERINPDVAVLDVDMPDLDGISALPLLLEKKRDLVVIMASTLTRRNAEASLRALSLGAADYIPKPTTNRAVTTSATFRRELIEKIRQLGGARRRTSIETQPPMPGTRRPPPAGGAPTRGEIASIGPTAVARGVNLRPFSTTAPRVLLIGASTGGPQALNLLVSRLAGVADRLPTLIAQHMPPTFTTVLAEHLARASGQPTREPSDGEPINVGTIYVAPGGRHMLVARRNNVAVIALHDGPRVNFCKPAVDPLFSSAANVWGIGTLAVILTGMGCDGTRGAADIVAAGGSVIVQDEATSVVWGMPGTALHAGVCSAVLPLDQIGPKVVRLCAGD